MSRARNARSVENGTCDFVGVLTNVRNGKAVLAMGDQLAKVVRAVMVTRKKGKMVVTIDLIPQSTNSDGLVNEVAFEIGTKLTVPEESPGGALFYPTPDGALKRDDPAQDLMFGDGDEE